VAVSRQMSGSVSIRPVRVGLVFKPTMNSVRRAVELATSTWGGLYHPLISSEDEASARRLTNALSVDILHPVDAETASERLARLPGYWWRAISLWGPFERRQDGITAGLLGPEWFSGDLEADRLILPRWEPTDPLSGLYAAWYGAYGSSKELHQIG
jgi:hypothetical protein